MPTNNFKLFDEKKANMMTDEEYAINQQRLNGVQSGVASSQLQNKTLYQTALMCYALAQLMTANGYDANDANAVSTFVNNLSLSVLQKVVDKASADDIKNKVKGKWVDSLIFGQNMESLAETYLKLAGGTMTGDLILNSDPIQSLQAATKQYVDKHDSVKLLYSAQKVGKPTLTIPVTWNMSDYIWIEIIVDNYKGDNYPSEVNLLVNGTSKQILSDYNYSASALKVLIAKTYTNTCFRSFQVYSETVQDTQGSFPVVFNKITSFGLDLSTSKDGGDICIYGYKQ